MSDRNVRRLRTCLWTAVCLGLLFPWGAHAAPASAACGGTDLAAFLAPPATPATAAAPLLPGPAPRPAATCPPLLCRTEYSSCLSQCRISPHAGCTTDCFNQYQACLRGDC